MTDLERGRALHNEGRYFEAHEAWEIPWREATDPLTRQLLQGLIQITAAFHKLFVMGNRGNAEQLLVRGLTKLEGLPEGSLGLDLERFRSEMRACRAPLSEGTLRESAVPKLHLSAPPS